MDEFKRGNIIRIYCKNFLTYDEIEIRPKPYLNIVIGPNGTGKSSLMCAICLGLGAKTDLSGRSKELQEYIRHGQTEAEIEVELFRHETATEIETICIRRKFSRNNESTWKLNGVSATKKVVDEQVRKLNLQVDNLCQFLPQERVVEFARMNSILLLENTEKSLQPKLYEMHDKVRNSGKVLKTLQEEFNELDLQIESESKKNERIAGVVESFNSRQEIDKKIAVLQKQRVWHEYAHKRNIYTHLEKERKAAIEELEEKKKELNPAMERIIAAEQAERKMVTEARKIDEQLRRQQKEYDTHNVHCHALEDDILNVTTEFNARKSEEEKRLKDLAARQKQLNMFENQLANAAVIDEAEIKSRQDQVSRNLIAANHTGSGIQNQIYTLKNEREERDKELKVHQVALNKAKDVQQKRLQLLRQINYNAFNAAIWLQQNMDLINFKGEVYLPMCTQINLKNAAYAKYVEDRISNQDLVAFVCTDRDDMNLLKKTMDGLKLAINVVHAGEVGNFTPGMTTTDLRRLGFTALMSDLIEAPSPIMNYLYRQYKVHMVPIGDVEKENVPDSLTMYYMAGSKFSKSKSRYDGVVSTSISQVREARLLTVAVNSDQIHTLEQEVEQLQQRISQIEADLNRKSEEFQQSQREIEKLRQEKQELLRENDERKQLITRIGIKKMEILKLQEAALDMDKEEKKRDDNVQKVVKNLVSYTSKLRKMDAELCEMTRTVMQIGAQLKQARECIRSLKDLQENSRQEMQELENRNRKIMEQWTEMREETRRALNQLTQMLEIANVNEITPAMRKELTRTDDEPLPMIMMELAQFEAQLDCLVEADGNLVKEFHRREALIHSLKEKSLLKKAQLGDSLQGAQEAQQIWLPQMRELTEKIGRQFSYFMREFGCAGEVELDEGEEGDGNPNKYGLKIKVKFRDSEKLRELTSQHQSGGERSVSTALYLLALQSLTQVPFRCVDEINQGMDVVNERKMTELMMKTAATKTSSQYFFISPKLLPDLQYNVYCNILLVYNSPCVATHKQMKLKSILRGVKKKLEGAKN